MSDILLARGQSGATDLSVLFSALALLVVAVIDEGYSSWYGSEIFRQGQ